jgi:hypothetical protein
MQTIDEAREHCRFVGKGIEKVVVDVEPRSCCGVKQISQFANYEHR